MERWGGGGGKMGALSTSSLSVITVTSYRHKRASIKPGTWNIPEHKKIEIFFYEKIIN